LQTKNRQPAGGRAGAEIQRRGEKRHRLLFRFAKEGLGRFPGDERNEKGEVVFTTNMGEQAVHPAKFNP